MSMPEVSQSESDIKIRQKASVISLLVSVILLITKFVGFRMTGSQGIFSDAMESIVNVLAAVVAIYAIKEAAKPADKEHPYGHGKLEYFSSIFEGGLVSFAGALILIEAVQSLIFGHEVRNLGFGAAILAITGIVNLGLGWYLIRIGRFHKSIALETSGKHVLSDVTTSAGIFIGILLVWATGLVWIDAVSAIFVGLLLSYSGLKIFRKSAGVLVDETDDFLISELASLFGKAAFPGMIRIHAARIIRSGRFHHIDAHIVVPEYWDVLKAHDEVNRFEHKVIDQYSHDGELHFHMDPCHARYCRMCDVENCKIRKREFEKRIPYSVEELISPNEPLELLRS